jgi:hypothetical protein
MKRTKDPMLEVFQKRDDATYREAHVQKEEKEALERRKNRRANGGKQAHPLGASSNRGRRK